VKLDPRCSIRTFNETVKKMDKEKSIDLGLLKYDPLKKWERTFTKKLEKVRGTTPKLEDDTTEKRRMTPKSGTDEQNKAKSKSPRAANVSQGKYLQL